MSQWLGGIARQPSKPQNVGTSMDKEASNLVTGMDGLHVLSSRGMLNTMCETSCTSENPEVGKINSQTDYSGVMHGHSLSHVINPKLLLLAVIVNFLIRLNTN